MVFVTVVVVDMHVVARLLMYVLHNLYFPMVFVTVVVDMHVVARLLMNCVSLLQRRYKESLMVLSKNKHINLTLLKHITLSTKSTLEI